MLPCCLLTDLLPHTWITPLVKPSGYCSLIEDHTHLLEHSSALPSIYLFASCWPCLCFWPCLIIKACTWICMPLVLSAPVTKIIFIWINESFIWISARERERERDRERSRGMKVAHACEPASVRLSLPAMRLSYFKNGGFTPSLQRNIMLWVSRLSKQFY